MTEEFQIYKDMDDILLRKKKLKSEIKISEKKMQGMWNELFHPRKQKVASTPSKRIASLIASSTGIIDGVLLGWKLYRRFKK